MRFSAIIAFALSAVAVSAHEHAYQNTTAGATTVTEVVTQYTTYCPLPTTIVEGNTTYTVTEATTLTISNCPCTRTKTYTTVTSTVCPGGCGTIPTAAPPAYTNGTTIPTSKPSVPVGNNTTPPLPTSPAFEGSANRATVAAGALAGLIGVAAYLL